MDRETEAAPRQAPPANGLPPIFQRPTYPSGEPATKAPERAPEEPSEPRAPREPRQRRERPEDSERRSYAASRPPRSGTAATEEAPAKRESGSSERTTGARVDSRENDAPAPRRRSRGGRGRGGRGRGGGEPPRETTRRSSRRTRPARTRTEPDVRSGGRSATPPGTRSVGRAGAPPRRLPSRAPRASATTRNPMGRASRPRSARRRTEQ